MRSVRVRTATSLSAVNGPGALEKNFSMVSLLGLAFAILNSWVAMSTSLSIALPSGGPTAIIWGDLVAGLGSVALAASLAEICAVYPNAAGQYYWTAVLSPPRYARVLSWICGWFNVAGWIFLSAAGGSLGGNLVTSIISLLHEDYVLKRWHIFLIYVAYTLGALVLNVFASPLLPALDNIALIWSLAGLLVISITILATASPNFGSGNFVFRQFINNTATFGLTAFDACAHMVEEIPNPSRHVPRAMVLAVLIGVGSSFVFLVILLFCLKDFNAVLESGNGPLLEIFFQATGSKAGSVSLLVIPVVCMAFTTQATLMTASRMTYAFARDAGLPFSRTLSRLYTRHEVPIPSLVFCTTWVLIFGIIFLASSSALNAIISSSVVSLNLSYGFPIAILLLRGRNTLPKGAFALDPVLGLACNVFGLIFVTITTVFFLFPPTLPTTTSSMNYTVVVFAIVGIISAATWIIDGHKSYQGPCIDDLPELPVNGDTEKTKASGESSQDS